MPFESRLHENSVDEIGTTLIFLKCISLILIRVAVDVFQKCAELQGSLIL